MRKMKDVVALIPTPLNDDGRLDETGLKRVIDFELGKRLQRCRCAGPRSAKRTSSIEPGGRTSSRVAVKHINGHAPLMVGCPAMGTYPAVDLCKAAEALGADAILAFNPQGLQVLYRQRAHYAPTVRSRTPSKSRSPLTPGWRIRSR